MVNKLNFRGVVFSRILSVVVGLCVMMGLLCCGKGSEQPAVTSGPSGFAGPSEPAVAPTVALTLKGRVFDLELALDDASRTQGLSDRKSIKTDGGMLFVFPSPGRTQFLVRRCYVPIDVIFIDEDGYIDSLHAMEVIEPIGGPRWTNPHTGYSTVGAIRYAVELRGGMIEELGLRRGEKIDLPEAVLQLKSQ